MAHDNEFALFSDLHAYLEGMTTRLSGIRRWKRYARPGYEFEDVCQHTVQQATICLLMLELERAYGDATGIDGERLLACALLHDQGEGLLGDVQWEVKQDPRLKAILEEKEHEYFVRDIVRPLPGPIAGAVERAYALQDDLESRTGRFFRASELIGYMIRAIHEYRSGIRALGQQVFVNQYEDMVAWGEEFAAVRVIFGAFRDEVEIALREDPECIRAAADRGKTARIQELLAERGNGKGNGATDHAVVPVGT